MPAFTLTKNASKRELCWAVYFIYLYITIHRTQLVCLNWRMDFHFHLYLMLCTDCTATHCTFLRSMYLRFAYLSFVKDIRFIMWLYHILHLSTGYWYKLIYHIKKSSLHSWLSYGLNRPVSKICPSTTCFGSYIELSSGRSRCSWNYSIL
jgi:hypothetical protein